MIPYKFKCSHWLKLQHSDWRANLVKDFFLQINFPPIRALEFIRDHVNFKLSYDFSYQMKTPLNFLTFQDWKLMILQLMQKEQQYHGMTTQIWNNLTSISIWSNWKKGTQRKMWKLLKSVYVLLNIVTIKFTHFTPPVAEISCVKNGRAIVVCGFLMK